jgi:hypothetical protein
MTLIGWIIDGTLAACFVLVVVAFWIQARQAGSRRRRIN